MIFSFSSTKMSNQNRRIVSDRNGCARFGSIHRIENNFLYRMVCSLSKLDKLTRTCVSTYSKALKNHYIEIFQHFGPEISRKPILRLKNEVWRQFRLETSWSPYSPRLLVQSKIPPGFEGLESIKKSLHRDIPTFWTGDRP